MEGKSDTCGLCEGNQMHCTKIDQEILGRKISEILPKFSNTKNKLPNIEKLCNECTLDVLYADHLVNKISMKMQKADDLKSSNQPSYTFKCKVCPFEIKNIKTFKKHCQEKHSDECALPYICNVCQKGFARHKILENHDCTPVTNTDVQPKVVASFDCQTCKYTTDKAKYFRRHMQRAHNANAKNIFKCLHCGKGYEREYFYMQHMIVQHQVHFDMPVSKKSKANASKILETDHQNNPSPPLPNKSEEKETSVAQFNGISSKKKKNKEKSFLQNDTLTPEDYSSFSANLENKEDSQIDPTSTTNKPLKKVKKSKRTLEEDQAKETKAKQQKIMEEEEELNGTMYPCKQCPKVSTSFHKLQKHLMKKHKNICLSV